MIDKTLQDAEFSTSIPSSLLYGKFDFADIIQKLKVSQSFKDWKESWVWHVGGQAAMLSFVNS